MEKFETFKPKLEFLDRWSEAKKSLESGEPGQFFLPEIELKDTFFTDPEMLKAIDEQIALKMDSLKSALAILNKAFPEQKMNGPIEGVYMELAKISVDLLNETKKELPKYAENKEEISEEAINIVEEAYSVPGLKSIVKKSEAGEQPEERTAVKPDNLPDHLKPFVEKKVLTDLYIQGKSLNDLGGLYSYLSNKKFEDTALHRAMSSSLQLTNLLGSFILMKKRMNPDALNGGNQNVRLGRVQVKNDESGEGSGTYIEASGATPSELTHEVSKGLLEYVMLDGSVPGKGEISEEDAKIFKDYLERPSVEYFEMLYASPLARKVDDALSGWIEEIKNESNFNSRRSLEGLLDLRKDDLDSSPNILLRLLKVVSLLPRKDLADFYQYCLVKKIPSNFVKILEKAKDDFDNSIN